MFIEEILVNRRVLKHRLNLKFLYLLIDIFSLLRVSFFVISLLKKLDEID